MPMVSRFLLIFFAFALLASCATQQELTGGEEDKIAPKILHEECEPKDQTVNFSENKIILPFDEYFTLNKPTETAILMPSHGNLGLEIQKKKLIITLPDSLQANTTYTIQLNHTIQDFHERNDSLIQFVFSTGPYIDSLKCTFKVLDTYTSTPNKSCIIGLYHDKDDYKRSKPSYFGTVNSQGSCTIKNIKEGNYRVLAFDDKNKDLRLQVDEKLGFIDTLINPSISDTFSIKVFQPSPKKQITQFAYISKEIISLKTTFSFKEEQFSLNGKNLDQWPHLWITEDSLTIFPSTKTGDTLNVLINSSDSIYSKMIVKRLSDEKMVFAPIQNVKDQVKLITSDSILFSFPSSIKSVNSADIRILKDSTYFSINSRFQYNQLILKIPHTFQGNSKLQILPGAISFQDNSNKDTLSLNFSALIEKDLGSILVNTEKYKETIVLLLMSNNKVIRTLPLAANGVISLKNILPGEYTFGVVLDKNQNGKWDTGELFKSQPEEIHWFNQPVKVRANWDVECILSPL